MPRHARLRTAALAVTLLAVAGCQGTTGLLGAGSPQGGSPASADRTQTARLRPPPAPELPPLPAPPIPDIFPILPPPGPVVIGAPGDITALGVAQPDLMPLVTLLMPTVTTVIDGSKGGTINAGRVRLDIPDGAFTGKATITVTMPDPSRFIVNLDIQPPSANQFKKPVEMRLNCGGLPWTRTPAAYWYNPASQRWYGLTQSDFSGGEVRVKLSHFSTYGAGGKAGW